MANEQAPDPAKTQTDAMAVELTREIMLRPDYKTNEYVAAIYRDADGSLKATELFTSGKNAEAPLGDALKAAGGAANVVGVIHNHPPSIVDAAPESDRRQSADINKLPSDGDWKGAREKFGTRTDVDYYILGPDQVLRKYDYQDNQDWDRKNEHAYWDRNHGRFPAGPSLATAPAPDPRDSDHPDHKLYQQIVDKTRDAYAAAGRPAAEGEYERVAASLLLDAKKEHGRAFTQADAVVFSVDQKNGEPGRHIFVVQGALSDPAHMRSAVKISEAASQSLESTFDKVYDVNQRQFLQEQRQPAQPTATQSEPAPAMAR